MGEWNRLVLVCSVVLILLSAAGLMRTVDAFRGVVINMKTADGAAVSGVGMRRVVIEERQGY